VLFAGLSYGDPSVVRASVMAALVLGARLLGRRIDLNNIIAATALVILIFDPAQLFDVGFQLSFATAWGLIFATPRVTSLFGGARKKRWFRWLVLPLIVTVIAQICSAPIIAFYFGRLSLIGPPANLVVVPMVSIAVLGVMIILLANLVWPLLGLWVGSLMDLWFRAVVGLLHLAGGDNIPVWDFGDALRSVPGLVLIGATYLPLILAALAIDHRGARRCLVFGAVVAADVVLGVVLIGSSRERAPSLECLAVPGGVAVVAQYGRDDTADLYISSLQNRSYQVDSSVIVPILSARGIERLERLVVLEADYGVIDALFRLAEEYSVEQSLYSSRLRPIVMDRLARRSTDHCAAPQFFGSGLVEPEVEKGVYLSEREVCVDNGEDVVVLTDRVRRDHFRTRPGPGVLVVGSTWSPAAADWFDLRRAGWSLVVCAKFEHDGAGDWPDDELRADGHPPEFVIDLAEDGPFLILPGR
jgi:ComEC/Rec2-related protein